MIEQVDEFGIRRRKKGNAAKYKNRVFQCPLCKWGHSNKASEKVQKHKEDCPALWIFKKWEPRPKVCEMLIFVKFIDQKVKIQKVADLKIEYVYRSLYCDYHVLHSSYFCNVNKKGGGGGGACTPP